MQKYPLNPDELIISLRGKRKKRLVFSPDLDDMIKVNPFNFIFLHIYI